MSRRKWMAAAWIFCLLTVLKLAVPGAAELIEKGNEQYLDRDDEYSWLSELLHRESAQVIESEPKKQLRTVAMPSIERVPSYRLKTLSQVQTLLLPQAVAPANETLTEKVTEALSVAENEFVQPEAVSEFLASQAEFASYALPENVSYEMPELPFSYSLPVMGYSSSGFGYRMHPVHHELRFHYGTDVAAYTGEAIYAFADGVISTATYSDSYGNYIVIDHGDGWKSLYAHCSQLLVNNGDEVSVGQQIALVGATGVVTGPHLHFELTCDGVYINPEYYVNYA